MAWCMRSGANRTTTVEGGCLVSRNRHFVDVEEPGLPIYSPGVFVEML